VKSLFSELAREDAARLIVKLHAAALTDNVGTAGGLVLYPLLKEFTARFGASPELLVILFDLAPNVHAEDEAGEYLRAAYKMAPNNEYALWQLLIARTDPWFPPELVRGTGGFDHDLQLIDRLLEQDPNDPLALGVRTRLQNTKKDLHAPVNMEFANNLHRLIPHPLRHADLVQLLLWR